MMAFSTFGSSDVVLIKPSHHQNRLINCSKLVFSTTHHKNHSKHKAIHRSIFVSKRKPESFEFDERKSPNEVKEEIKQCYEFINRLGRGIVYLGSSRIDSSHSHYVQAQELAKEKANLLDSTTWSGAGPGLMDAVTQSALLAGKPVDSR